MGPIYSEGGGSHKYMPQVPMSDHQVQMNGPVFKGVESHNQFNPAMDPKPRAGTPMTGPVLPCDNSSHYIPMEEPKIEFERFMSAPTYRGINIERHNQVSAKKLINRQIEDRNLDIHVKDLLDIYFKLADAV